MTNKEYTSYCGSEVKVKGRTQKEDIANLWHSIQPIELLCHPWTVNGEDRQQHQGLSEISESDFRPNI